MTTRALVLGGGGPVGIAWEAGVLLGLRESGVDLDRFDHVIGTSAGAFVGARFALGHAPIDIAKPYMETETSPKEASSPASRGASSSSDAAALALLFQTIQDAARAGRSTREIAREVGALALRAETMSEEEFVARFVPSLRPNGAAVWPSRSYVCTAFDAESGAFETWDGRARVDLARAVASSCAVPGVFPAITIGEKRYFDGGVLSTTNAHLAEGHDVVVVLAVMEILMRYAAPPEKKTPLQREIEALRERGSRVEVISFDAAALQVVGPQFMDRSRQPLAVREGLRQGRALAADIVKAVSA
jgi:NTE family protein